MPIPVALTIAGSDSGGGAGIQADLKTFHAFGVFGTSAITALTAQNTRGVRSMHAAPAQIVREQIEAVASDFEVRACKTGMLATREIVELIAFAITQCELPNFVLDPVMVATSGDRLLASDAETAILSTLMPLCTVITPNLDEASILARTAVRDASEMEQAARTLVEQGARAALIKGGHLDGDEVIDVLFDGEKLEVFKRPRLTSTSTHGTGCTLSAAVAAGLAHGRPLRTAVADALEFVHNAIRTAPGIGHGHGPLNHFTAAPTNAAS